MRPFACTKCGSSEPKTTPDDRLCRFHGARGGAPKGKANGAYRHGLYTVEAVEERRWMRELLDEARETVDSIL